MRITLKDGTVKVYERPLTLEELAGDLSERLRQHAAAGLVDGTLTDLREELTADCSVEILTFQDERGRDVFRHTTAHILAQAVKRLYPETKLAIGPAIADGFYYDFDREVPFSQEELMLLEKEMQRIVKEGYKITRFTLTREEALQLAASRGEDYKKELIEELPEDEPIRFYQQGEYIDLCAGPHLLSVAPVKAFHLTKVAGAYWKGSEKNKMLTRIYGTSFPKKADLKAYLEQMEEARK